MNLHEGLRGREAEGTPVRVGVIGAGRFGTMFLAHAHTDAGHSRRRDRRPRTSSRAREALRLAEWPQDEYASSLQEALRSRTTAVLDDAIELIEAPVDVIVEATGNPVAGIDHALRTIDAGHDIVMVNVEADALAGPALAARARSAGVVYSLAYGDQPAMICELIDWARTSGFELVCAGKGTKYLPHYHRLNPDNVWDAWEFSPELTGSGQLSATMHTSFRDGTKAAIEMAAVANSAGLRPADGGLNVPAGLDTRTSRRVCRPHRGRRHAGAVADGRGRLERRPPGQLAARSPPGRRLRRRQGAQRLRAVVHGGVRLAGRRHAISTWRCTARMHFVGLELNITIASAAVRREATGTPTAFRPTSSPSTKEPLTGRATCSTARVASRSGAG